MKLGKAAVRTPVNLVGWVGSPGPMAMARRRLEYQAHPVGVLVRVDRVRLN